MIKLNYYKIVNKNYKIYNKNLKNKKALNIKNREKIKIYQKMVKKKIKKN